MSKDKTAVGSKESGAHHFKDKGHLSPDKILIPDVEIEKPNRKSHEAKNARKCPGRLRIFSFR